MLWVKRESYKSETRKARRYTSKLPVGTIEMSECSPRGGAAELAHP